MPPTLPRSGATRPAVAAQRAHTGDRPPLPPRRRWLGGFRLRDFFVAPFRDIDDRVRVAGQ